MNTPRLKSYWNCDTQQQQQPQSNCYTNSPHKSSPHHQAWSRSPNMISSPSTTPSPIPCPSTPHHFASSPHHHATDSTHKPYNNGLMGSPNVNGSGGGSCGNNPLQSLQKMVQIESESGTHYDGSSAVPIQQSGPQQQQQATTAAPTNAGHSMMDSDQSAYPTYYNLDQNRLCSTPQAAAAYSAIPTAQSMNSTPFSPTLKNSAEMQRSQLSNCVKQEIAENGELSRGSTAAAARYPKLTKETPVQNSSSASTTYLNNGSCSTDSNGSPTAQTNKIVSIPESVMQTDQTHDSINSFRGSETTANSRDSVKSTDSDAMSSYAVSQCSTPNNWKVNSGQVGGQQPSGEFRSNNFNNSQKSWWADNSGQPLSSQQMPDQCSQFASGVNYSPSQLSNQMQSNSSMSPSSQSWSQQPSMAAGSQIGLTGANFPADGVVVKKKRGRPFGSKNRRNLETPPNVPDTSKRRRKITLVDMAVNTNLSFNVQASLYQDDAMAFSSTLGLKLHPPQQPKQPPPQPLTRRKKQQFGGPVIRIDKTQPELHNSKYSIVNSFKSQEDDKDKVQKSINESYSQTRKYGLSKSKKSLLLNSNHANSNSCGTLNKNWICILCHKGPNYKGLGDLYGPYVISLDKSKLCFSQENDAPTNVVNENHHEDCDTTVEQPQQPERRSLRRRTDEKSNHVEDATKDITGKQDVDVWIHEDCIVWSNNVYLEGTKIRNLEPAIVESFESVSTVLCTINQALIMFACLCHCCV